MTRSLRLPRRKRPGRRSVILQPLLERREAHTECESLHSRANSGGHLPRLWLWFALVSARKHRRVRALTYRQMVHPPPPSLQLRWLTAGGCAARKARPPRPPVIIKRPARVLAHPRVHEDDLAPASSSETMETDAAPASDPPDEMAHIRALLRPPPIPGATDWGIPPEPTGPPGTEIQVGLPPSCLARIC